MKKTFNGTSRVGQSNFMGTGNSIYKAVYKTNSKNYIMHNPRKDGTVTLTVGTKNKLAYSGWWMNS